MLRSRLSSFVAVRLLGAEPIGGEPIGGGGADWRGRFWGNRFGGGPIVCRADLGAIWRDAMMTHRCLMG